MELFATDIQKIEFLLETESAIFGEDLRAEALAAEEVVSEELSPDKRPKYVTNYIGSKQKLVDWIWKSTPDDVKSVFDAFSGSAVVGYMYKTKGMKVVTNDRLRFSYHAARALIENSSTRLSAEDIEKLVSENSNAKDFIQKTFKGLFFAPGVHKVIDLVRTNIDGLSGYKKDIALLALCRTCLGAKGGFGHFSAADNHKDRSYDSPAEFIERFKKLCNRINSLVFDNGHENKAHNQDIMELAPSVKVHLAYFDPPYATHFSTTNYEKSYHFLEGLVTYWKDKEIDKNTKVNSYKIDSTTVTQSNANEFFSEFLGKSKHIKYWLISYRDKAYPSESEMKKIIAKVGKSSRMKSKDHSYSITSKRGEASQAKEHLFICSPGKSAQAAVTEETDLHAEAMESQAVWEEIEHEIRYRVRDPRHFLPDSFRRKEMEGMEGVSIILAKLKPDKVPKDHDPDSMIIQAYRFAKNKNWTMEKAMEWIKKHQSSADSNQTKADDSNTEPMLSTEFPVEICLQATADEQSDQGDKRFSFILCHAGTNNNGDHFLVEELASRYQTAINQKINLKHSRDITDIVGGVVASDFVEDGKGPRVECIGELYTQDNDHARLAHKLMKKGIITQVSMECGYQSGECSVCGKKISNKANYCLHLKKYKGREFNGQVVYEILRGISFTGLGLLDRKGADENAKITAVSQLNNNQQGGDAMSEEKDKLDKNAAKKNQGGGGGDGGNSDQDKDSLIKQLQEENQKLKQQLADLQKQVEKYEAETQAAVRKSRAEKLLGKLEKHEVGFAAEERGKELTRLSGLGDEAFTATEAAYDQMLAAKKKEPEKKPDNEGKKDDQGPKAKADSNRNQLRTDAGVAPHIVDDKKSNLEGKLTNGFMEAYKERVGQTA